jgi:hypothetical protein
VYAYTYAGAAVHSALPLPELPSRARGADPSPRASGDGPAWLCAPGPVPRSAHRRLLQTWFDDDGDEWLRMSRTDDGYRLSFAIGVDVHVAPPAITWQASASVGGASLRHLLLDQVLPLANSCRGVFGLHGSAVVIDGEAIAFVGRGGQGKSTLAAAMTAAGAALLADDYVVVQRTARGWQAVPSYPGARLWADSRKHVMGGARLHARPVADYTTKARLPLPSVGVAVPLRWIVLPEWGPSDQGPQMSAARAADAVDLLRFVFRLDVEDRAGLERDFDTASALVRDAVVKRLRAPRRFDALPQTRAEILGAA